MTDYATMDIDSLFREFQKIPDWDRFPMPEVFYEHFKVKKPQSLSVNESATYFAPPSLPLGNGKTEIRGPLPGGVREVPEGPPLPVEVKVLTDQTDDDTMTSSHQNLLTPPTEHNRTETLGELGPQSQDPSCASGDTSRDAPCRDAECSPPSQPPQNQHSFHDQIRF